MTCDDARKQLTAYLDGELAGDRGSAVRGHLRGCTGCREAAADEAALRDGLRQLPPIDPPPSLWAGVQAQLAAAEVRDAELPAWRRALSRWAPLAPRFGLAGVALAAAVGLLVWRARHPESAPPPVAAVTPRAPIAPAPHAPASASPAATPLDVTADLAQDAVRAAQGYEAAADELLHAAREARAGWSDERKQTFDARLSELRKQVDTAADGRPRDRAYRALVRYLQGAALRDEVAANDRVFAAPGGAR